MKKLFIFMVISLLSILLLTGCRKAQVQKIAVQDKQEIIIFAAASLTPLLEEISKQYKQEFPDTEIILNAANTQLLKMQIEQGAKADLFLAARERDAKDLVEKGFIRDYTKFLGNHLEIVASKEGSQKIQEVEDLCQANIRIVLADQTVPVGEYSIELLDNLERSDLYGENLVDNLTENIVSYENNEQLVLGKILNGEADAGIVFRSSYKTSIANNGAITAIPFVSKYNIQSYYYLAELNNTKNEIKSFTKWLQTDKAKKIIEKFGLESI